MTDSSNDESNEVKRRARKRELDRRAQRAARERTRSRIAVLEATIEAMRSEDSGARAAQLMDELTQTKMERDGLANTLRSIRELTARQLGPIHTKASETPLDLRPVNPQPSSPGHSVTLDAVITDAESSALSVDLAPAMSASGGADHHTTYLTSPPAGGLSDSNITPDLHAAWPDELPMDLSLMNASPLSDGLILPEPLAVCDCIYPPAAEGTVGARGTAQAANTSIWRTANRILTIDQPFTQNMLRLEDDACEDVPIRVILEGWDSVNSQKLPLLWQKLHEIDLLQFKGCNNVERLAIFIIMHRMLRQRADPSAKSWSRNIPLWLAERFVTPISITTHNRLVNEPPGPHNRYHTQMRLTISHGM